MSRGGFMKNQPLVSFIIPTYNSENVLDIALASIRRQTIDQNDIEIIVIDGGSTDKTLEIAEKYNATVLSNPHRLPEPGALIGLKHATGKYLVRTGSDEELLQNDQIQKRINLFERFPEIKCIVIDKIRPVKSCGIASAYMNYCDDPFSFVIYKKKQSILSTYRNNIVANAPEGCKLAFTDNDLKPIGDGATTMISLDYVRSTWAPETWNVAFWSGMFDNVVSKTGCCGCIRDDEFRHYSNATFKIFLSKQRFRVINNIFDKQNSGFSVRSVDNKKLQTRKRWFYIYALTFIGPLFDSIKLSIHYRDASMLLHIFYIYYICVFAAFCHFNKLFGKTLTNKSYGKQ